MSKIMLFFFSSMFLALAPVSLFAVGGNDQVRKLDLYWSNYERALNCKDSAHQISVYRYSHDIDFDTVLDQSKKLMVSQDSKDRERAHKALDRLIQVKFLPAYQAKAQMLACGQGLEKDLPAAVSLLTVMKDIKGGQSAYGQIGDLYTNHSELGDQSQRVVTAQNFYAQGGEKGDPYCLHAHGIYCLYNDDVQKGYDLLDQAAEDYQYLPSQMFLGFFHVDLSTVNYDSLLAQHYFSQAYFKHKDGFAAAQVGRIMVNNELTHDDDGNQIDPGALTQVGINWLKSGSEAGNIYAAQLLEDIYSRGEIVDRDIKQAREYAIKALKMGKEQGMGFCPPLTLNIKDQAHELDLSVASFNYSCKEKMRQVRELFSKDKKEAILLLEYLVQKKYTPAMISLALLHKSGDGVPLDVEKTYALFKEAADLGDAVGQSNYAYILYAGPESVRDIEQAQVYWKKACEQDQPCALYNYGAWLIENSDRALEGFAKIQKAADFYNKDACFSIGKEYAASESKFVERDPDSAFAYFVKAFDGKDKRVARAILQLVKEGEFRLPTITQGPEFAAIVDGLNLIGPEDPSAFYEIGEFYRKGKIFQQNSQRAMMYYRSGAQGGNPESCYRLGLNAIDSGNKQEAAEYFRQGAAFGSTGCKLHYGQMLLTGSGVSRDVFQAVTCLLQAQKEGSIKAGEYLGRIGELLAKSIDVSVKEYDADGETIIAQMRIDKKTKTDDILKVSQEELRGLQQYQVVPYARYAGQLLAIQGCCGGYDRDMLVLEQFSDMLHAARRTVEKKIKIEQRRVKKKKKNTIVMLKTQSERQRDEINKALEKIEEAQVLGTIQSSKSLSTFNVDTAKEKQCVLLFGQKDYDGALVLAKELAASGSTVGFMTLGRCVLFGEGSTRRNIYAGIKLLSYGRSLISQENSPGLYDECTKVLNNAGPQIIEYARAFNIASDPEITQEFCDAVMCKEGEAFMFNEQQRTYLLLSLYQYFLESYNELKKQSDKEIVLLRAQKNNNFKSVSTQLAPLYHSLKIVRELLPASTFDD